PARAAAGPRKRSEELRDVLVAEQEAGRGESHAPPLPPQPSVRESAFHPFHTSRAAHPHDVFIVYAGRLPEPEKDRLAPNVVLRQCLREVALPLLDVSRVGKSPIADE